jgi:Flp pilus assembly protein TadB
VILLAGLTAALSAVLLSDARSSARLRVIDRSGAAWHRASVGRVLPGLSGLSGAAAAVAVGGPFGVAVGVAVAVVIGRLATSVAQRASETRDRALRRELPLALDLVGACVAAGSGPRDALRAVAVAMPEPTRAALRAVCDALSLGLPGGSALDAGAAGIYSGLLRAVSRAGEAGVGLAELLTLAAADAREQSHAALSVRVRRAGVLAAAPLGLCFLPAFVLLAVVPLALGLAGGLLPR